MMKGLLVTNYTKDEDRIREIIGQMFEAVSWSETKAPDFTAFASAVRKDAVLVPSARPANPTDIKTFVDRMSGQHSSGAMKDFDEKAHKTKVTVFGNLAVAIGSYVARIDNGPLGRGANGFLFIRNDGDWQIAAMSWDNESEEKPLPPELI
jgi:ketosteroid isomerase-like protein